MPKKNIGKWIDKIFGSVGKYVHMDTTDGIRRSGKLTGFRTKDINFNGEVVPLVTELELNGDPTDCVPVMVLESITID